MRRIVVSLALLIVFAPFVAAGPAPESISFQGVLRDAADNPLDGDYDMTFRLFDVPFGGTELYFDAHEAAGLGAVSVSQGLFTVAIGTGIHSNASLANIFRDHIELYVEIEVGGETLSPRVAIHSAGHALNAGNAENAENVGGISAGQFLRSDTDDVSAGTLRANMLESDTGLALNVSDAPTETAVTFFTGGIPGSERKLSFDPAIARFKFDAGLSLGNYDLYMGRRLYLNQNTSWDYVSIFFGDSTGGPEAEYFRRDLAGTFQLSDDLSLFDGDLRADTLYVDWRGNSNGAVYFWSGGDERAEWVAWDGSYGAFRISDDVLASGELWTDANQIVLNRNGPDANQDIEFFNGVTQAERFQWDATALRFEVSDDFHAFGSLSADVKNFVQNHPYRDDLEIVYTSLEGNEVTTFTRGSGRLVNGEARIELEESFRYVTNPDIGLSAHLTPRGPSLGLYTASVSTSEIVVRSIDDDDDVAFDFVVYGLRIGYEDHPVYRAKRSESFVPLPDRYQAELSAASDLAEHTALARYRRMSDEAFGAVDTEMAGAWSLREAIGMRELNVDYPRGSEISVRDMNRAAVLSGEDRNEPEPSLEGESSPGAAPVAGLQRDAEGNVYARSFRPSAGDIASLVPVGEPVEAGDVLVIDPHAANGMMLARRSGDTAVFGVVAAEPGVVLGAKDPENADATGGEVPVAVSGVVLCKVDATFGEIRPGDLLQTSPNPGHAMRADDPRTGSVLGKALEPLDAGAGTIRVLVTLR